GWGTKRGFLKNFYLVSEKKVPIGGRSTPLMKGYYLLDNFLFYFVYNFLIDFIYCILVILFSIIL
ncbi:MAG: hypothetical protein ACP5KI_01610, partial [Brevinematia bacterium]